MSTTFKTSSRQTMRDTPRELMHRWLACGDITPADYEERKSLLDRDSGLTMAELCRIKLRCPSKHSMKSDVHSAPPHRRSAALRTVSQVQRRMVGMHLIYGGRRPKARRPAHGRATCGLWHR